MENAVLDRPAKAPIKKRKQGERGPEIPLMVKLKVRTMYLNSGETMRAIATATGLTEMGVRRLVHKQGWTKMRSTLKETLEREQDAERDDLVGAAMEQIKNETVAIAGDSMARIRKALESDDRNSAKDFQALTAGARNLVTIAKSIMVPGATGSGDGATVLNVFIQRTPGKDEAKPVQEIEAKRVQ